MKPRTKNLLVAIFFFIIAMTLLKKKQVDDTAHQIYTTLVTDGIPHDLALLIVAQTKHETAIGGIPYTSPLFLRANNIAGYGYVKNNALQTGSAGQHPEDSGVYARYASVIDAAHDLAGWYRRRSSSFYWISDASTFVNALKSAHYFTAPTSQYLAGVKNFFSSSIS